MTANILNPAWRYVRSEATDIRKTYAKARKAIAEQQKREEADKAEAAKKVSPMKRGAK